MKVMTALLLLSILWTMQTVSVAAAASSSWSSLSSNSNSSNNTSTIVVPHQFIGMDVHGDPVMLPLLGAGTWQYNDTIAYQSLCKAFSLQQAYTLVDTAFGYKNQKGVGKAIRDCWQRPREELFVMTKIPGGLGASQVEAAHKQNLLELQLDYVDHLMTHFPSDWKETNASPEARREEWKALEAIYERGEARSIGVSHYCTQHLEDILWTNKVMPSINQVEMHIGSQDVDTVRETCSDLGITFMSFSPLCGPCEYDDPKDSLINGELVTEIASHYPGKSGAQVSLRFLVQQGIPVIPKSNTLAHIQSNMEIFDFELTDEDMQRLAKASKPAAEAGDCDVKATAGAITTA